MRRVGPREALPPAVRLEPREVERRVRRAHYALPDVIDAVVLVPGTREARLVVLLVLLHHVPDDALFWVGTVSTSLPLKIQGVEFQGSG